MNSNAYFYLKSYVRNLGDFGATMILIAGMNYLIGREGWSNFDFLIGGAFATIVAIAGWFGLKYVNIKWER